MQLQRQSSQQQQLEAAQRAARAHEEHLQSVQARGRALLESQDRDLTAPVVYDAEWCSCSPVPGARDMRLSYTIRRVHLN